METPIASGLSVPQAALDATEVVAEEDAFRHRKMRFRVRWYCHLDLTKELNDTKSIPMVRVSAGTKIPKTIKKVKRGIPGYLNGLEVSALPDTGASQNIITLAYAKRNNLQIDPLPTSFTLGNRNFVTSIGKRKSSLLTPEKTSFVEFRNRHYRNTMGICRKPWKITEALVPRTSLLYLRYHFGTRISSSHRNDVQQTSKQNNEVLLQISKHLSGRVLGRCHSILERKARQWQSFMVAYYGCA